ncbi:MAG: hypothetical protein ACOYOT_07240 [Bacteroidales bacterium]
MSNPKIVKWSISATVTLIVCLGAYFVYERFADERSAAKTDLMRLIPEHCDAFLSVDDFEKLKDVEQNSLVQIYLNSKTNPSILRTLSRLRPYFNNKSWKSAEGNLHQMIISFHSWENSRAELLLFKMAAGDKEEIQKIIETYFKSSFTPLEESNAGITVKHYYVSTGLKLHCFFYKGIFAASYNNRLIDETIVRMKAKTEVPEADFIDIANEQGQSRSLKFFIRLNGIPLVYGNNPDKTDTLDLAEWVAPELQFEKDKIEMNCATSPLFENKNQLSSLIGQTPGRPLNPAIISEKCSFCIHYGLSDLDRFYQNQSMVFGESPKDSSIFRTDNLSIDSIFSNHFDSEINIAYYPVNVPERQYQKVIVIRLTDEAEFMSKLSKLYDLRDINDEEALVNKAGMIALPEAFVSSVFGQTFAIDAPLLYCDLVDNYLVVASRPETVKSYIADIKSSNNISDKIWYHEISSEIDSKSNLYFIGRGNSFIEDQYILPFGIPRFLLENQFLFRNNVFCFQFSAEESFIHSNTIIKQLKR